MANNIRLYKDIYHVEYSLITGSTYNLISPISITADIYLNGTSSLIESPVVKNESLGVYFVELNPILYTFTNIYETRWRIKYTSNSPIKTLLTRFRVNPINIGNGIDIEIVNNQIFIEV